jgi:hypothetical protein
MPISEIRMIPRPTEDYAMPAPRLAISSHIPGVEHHGWHWPVQGEATVEDVVRGMPHPRNLTVLALPTSRGEKLHFQPWAHWVILEIAETDYVEDGDTVKFTKGSVVFNGPNRDAAEYLRKRGLPVPRSINLVSVDAWSDLKAGDWAIGVAGMHSTVRVGDNGVAFCSGDASAGDYGLVTSHFGEVTVGDWGCAITRDGPMARGGKRSLVSCGEFGEAHAGDSGVAIASSYGRAVAGERGLAIARDHSNAHVDRDGIALVDQEGTASGSAVGAILIFVYQSATGRRVAIGKIGENGLLPNVKYCVDDSGTIRVFDGQ